MKSLVLGLVPVKMEVAGQEGQMKMEGMERK